MKILIVRTFPNVLDTKNYNSQEIGLARAFVRAGHVCDIVYFGGKAPAHDQQVPTPGCETAVTIHWLAGVGVLKNGFFKGLAAIAKQYDVIQVAEYDQITSRHYYRNPKGKVVTLYHGPYESEFTKGYNMRCGLFDLLFNRPQKNKGVPCFAKSRMAARFLRTKGFEDVLAVGVGLDLDTLGAAYDPTVRPAAAHKKEEFRLLYIGVLEERRNIRFLFEVLAASAEVLPNVRLTLVGRGDAAYRDACFAYAEKLGVRDRIDYQERVPQDQVYQLYQQANLFVLPTKYEIFGMVLLEAMYYGLPVLTSHNGGSDLLVKNEENGFVVQEFKAKDYVKVIAGLACDPEKQVRIGAAAHETVVQDFTWDSIAQKMLKVYAAQQQKLAKTPPIGMKEGDQP